MQLEEFYPRNKKRNENPFYFYQGQYNWQKEIMRYIIKNYLQ